MHQAEIFTVFIWIGILLFPVLTIRFWFRKATDTEEKADKAFSQAVSFMGLYMFAFAVYLIFMFYFKLQ